MREELNNNVEKILPIALLGMVGCIGGGYYVFASAILGIVLSVILVLQLWKTKQYKIAVDGNIASLLVIVLGYLCTGIWAIDSGMAIYGFVKFFPLILWGLYICTHLEYREYAIHVIPYIGSLMTLFSALMMQFEVFKSWVTVAGRLAGFFQYPNTYAMFMLICMVISIHELEETKDYGNIFNVIMAVIGIAMSGSRTVYIMFGVAVLIILIRKKNIRKTLFMIIAVGIVVIILEKVIGRGIILQRITGISMSSSTLLGRLLYWKDALPVILKHPFGMGYYGYYYIQQEIQTGVYSVANVHNEFLQLMLDIGVIPAVVVFGNFIRSIVKAENNRNRSVIAIIVIHSVFDYDFQFMFIWMVLVLFLDFHNLKCGKIPIFTRVCLGMGTIGVSILSIIIGSSDLLYLHGDTKLAVKVYEGNTQAQIALLTDVQSTEAMEKQAEKIIQNNAHVAVAYSALARSSFSKGEIDDFIKYKLTAIKLAPYQYDEYVDYLDTLLYCADEYLEKGELESAKTCVLRAVQIPELLQAVENKTSDLSWKIKDIPQVKLSHKNLSKIEEYQSKINQN